jgi:hypothetical protein
MEEKNLEYNIKFHKIATDNVKKLSNGNWLDLQEVEYIDPNAKEIKKWEFCKRIDRTSTENKKNIDGKIFRPNFLISNYAKN